ncbi:DUF3054 domain-containing protein [Arthrobacter sp. 35/47]|uniref:DUF3054 domain-containing protein n=1 Tax=Arthrobacter sp. 35/47 TaxID=269454 RepID=UPI000A058D3E|nr:DUF3054 domain-containing protein [Arthrobacter sp. 35/47]
MRRVNAGRRDGARLGYPAWLAADVVLILLFAMLGHQSHYGTLSPAGIAGTALPFLAAYGAATAALRPWRHPTALMRCAVPLWIGTSAGGLILRVLAGQGAALSFQIVAVSVLGLFLITPRVLAALVRRRRVHSPAIHSPSKNQGAPT